MEIQMIYGIAACVLFLISIPFHCNKMEKWITSTTYNTKILEKGMAWMLDTMALILVVGVFQIMNDVMLIFLGLTLVICLGILLLQSAKNK